MSRGGKVFIAALVVGLLVLGVVLLLTIGGNSDEIDRIERVGYHASDESCLLFERDHRQDVRQLRRTYNYLGRLTADEVGSTLNQTIIAQLSQYESDAKNDAAPPHCDDPAQFGDKYFGLKEPDPKLPERPKRVDTLLSGQD